jgi:hypothetical protein
MKKLFCLIFIVMVFATCSYSQKRIKDIEEEVVYNYVDNNARYAVKLTTLNGKITLDLTSLGITSLDKLISINIICKQKAGDTGIYAYTLSSSFNPTGGDIYIYDCKNNIAAVDGINVYISIIYNKL